MLVISRKADQTTVVARHIHVTVVEVLTSNVVIDIRCPRGTRVEWEATSGRSCSTATRDNHDICIVLDTHGTLLINRVISMTLVEVKQEKARFGFIAPKHISVQRHEVVKKRGSSEL